MGQIRAVTGIRSCLKLKKRIQTGGGTVDLRSCTVVEVHHTVVLNDLVRALGRGRHVDLEVGAETDELPAEGE